MRIVIADDHALFRDSLKSLLESRGYEVVGEARNGSEAVELGARLRPDVLLMDLSMPELDGIAATRLLRTEAPEVKVVMLTAAENDAPLFEAIKAGAHGYMQKNLESASFFALLDGVTRGEPALSPGLARRVLAEFAQPRRNSDRERHPDDLTEREREVLELLVSGVTSNRKLAKQLEVSENTIKFHLRNILEKLHLNNRAEAVSYALRHRMVKLPDDTD
ncbi:MAG: response regulator transcription factor [Thermoanaerobaculia bacterium]